MTDCHTIDLHIHTTISDGLHPPSEIVSLARTAGLHTIAITDHDAVEGIPEALAAAEGGGLEVLAGVEVSADMGHAEIHILGYLIDWRDAELVESLALSRASRLERLDLMLERLRAIGIHVSREHVLALADGGSVGRPHVAMAMREGHHVETIQEAFDRYLAEGRPAYVPRAKMTPGEAIARIRAAGGLAVLAHPWGITSLVPELVKQGLAGLEVYYTGYTPAMSAELIAIAKLHGLVCTGGSDFHGLDTMPENLLGGVAVPSSCVEQLKEHWQAARLAKRPAAKGIRRS